MSSPYKTAAAPLPQPRLVEGYQLVDLDDPGRELPDSFQILPKDVRQNCPRGAMAKLIFRIPTGGVEILWVQVTHTGPEGFRGELRNSPFGTGLTLAWGDQVAFACQHILEIAK